MARKRFKILEGALDYLRTDSTDDNPDAPTGTPLKFYQDWRKGSRNVNYERLDSSKPGEIKDAGIIPFGGANLEDNRIKVPISLRASNSAVGQDALTVANTLTEDVEALVAAKNFEPAKAIITVPFNDTRTGDPISKLTGLKYKRSNRTSYTIPYGASTTYDREGQVRAAITAAVTAANSSAEIQFVSENF